MSENGQDDDPCDQLSLAAQGALDLLQRLPELPSASARSLAEHSASGATAAGSALTELERMGFLRRWRQRRDGGSPGFDYPWRVYPGGDAPPQE